KRFLSDSSMSQLITHAPPRYRERADRRTPRDADRDSYANVRTLGGEERGLWRRCERPGADDCRLSGRRRFEIGERLRDGEAGHDRPRDIRHDTTGRLAHGAHHGAAIEGHADRAGDGPERQ